VLGHSRVSQPLNLRLCGSVGVLRAMRCHLRAGFQQCKSFVEMCAVRCCPLWHPSHCPMGTVPRVLVRSTASPSHTDFGGLSSGAAPVVVRLDVVSFPPSSSAQTVAGCRWGGYPVGRDRWGGKRGAGGMSEDNDRCFSMLVLGAFSTGVFQHHCITDVWGESSIMTGVYQRWCSSTLHIG
jgi:hypothetical protein